MTAEMFERFRSDAIAVRRAELEAITADPSGHGWPDEYLVPGRSKRGETGVDLATLARALGCSYQALKPLLRAPYATVAVRGKAIEVWHPDELHRLARHPKVLAARERKLMKPDDKDRLAMIGGFLALVEAWHLVHASIEGFRTIDFAEVDLDALTVLIGRNGAGKSSLLDAMRLAGAQTPDWDGGWAAVSFCAQGQQAGGSPDPRMIAAYCSIGLPEAMAEVVFSQLTSCLQRPTIVGKPKQWLLGLPPSRADPDQKSIERLLMTANMPGRLIPRLLEAASLDSDAPMPLPGISVAGPDLSLTVLGADMESLGERLHRSLPEAVERIPWLLRSRSQSADEGDALGEVAEQAGLALSEIRTRWASASGQKALPGYATHIAVERVSTSGRETRVLALSDTESLDAEFEDMLNLIVSNSGPQGLQEAANLLGGLIRFFGPDGEDSAWFAKDELAAICSLANLLLVESLANEFAPGFVAEEGRIVLLPPKHTKADEIGVGLLDVHSGFTDIQRLPSGIGRWVALLVEFAVGLARSKWNHLFHMGGPDLVFEMSSIPLASAQSLAESVRRIPVPSHSLQLLLADEPELHLHPSAQEEVVQWMLRMSGSVSAVVATHAPAFLRLSPSEARLVRVSRVGGRGTQATTLDGDFLQSLDTLAMDLGLGREGILQLTRGFVVVEGLADEAVFSRFAQSVIHRYRLCLLPIGGHSRSRGFVEGDLAAAIGLPIAAIFDDVTADELARYLGGDTKGSSDEVKSAARLLELRERGLNCEIVPFDAPDVIEAIPEETVRRRFPKFDSWPAMRERWQETGRALSYKNFVLDSWQVSRRDDFATIEALARDRQQDDAFPPALLRTLKALESWAERLGVEQVEVPA